MDPETTVADPQPQPTPPPAADAAIQADLAQWKTRAAAAEQRAAAAERARDGLKADIVKLKPYRDLGELDELQALKDQHDAATAVQEETDREPEAEPATPEAVRLAERRAEIRHERQKRRHAEELKQEREARQSAEAKTSKLQSGINDSEVVELIRRAGGDTLKPDLVAWLVQNLRPCFKKEEDGTWTLRNPRTEATLVSAVGGAMGVPELLELAHEPPNAAPWGEQNLVECFKSNGTGSGTLAANAAISAAKPVADMTTTEKTAYVSKYGLGAWQQKVDAEAVK